MARVLWSVRGVCVYVCVCSVPLAQLWPCRALELTGVCGLCRHYSLDAYLPLRLRPESMEKLHCLRACVIRSLFHMYEPFAARLSRNPAIPDSTPSTLKNSRVSGITEELFSVWFGFSFLEEKQMIWRWSPVKLV